MEIKVEKFGTTVELEKQDIKGITGWFVKKGKERTEI